jgi:tetratricopeptide (TPR) repeat protein
MRTRILLLATLLTFPPALAAQVPQVPRGSALSPDMERLGRHYAAGWGMMRSEDWEGAVREFQAVIDIDPRFANAYYSLGRAEMALRHFPKAIDAYTKSREVYMTSSGQNFTNQLNGTKYLDDRILEQKMALQQAQQAGGVKQGTGTQQLYIIELNNKIRDLEQQRDRNQNLNVDTTVPFYIPLALGAAYQRSGKLEDAEREYKAAIDANSASGESHNNLAVLYMTTRRFDEATSEVKLAEKTGFKVNPQFKEDLEAKRKGKF